MLSCLWRPEIGKLQVKLVSAVGHQGNLGSHQCSSQRPLSVLGDILQKTVSIKMIKTRFASLPQLLMCINVSKETCCALSKEE